MCLCIKNATCSTDGMPIFNLSTKWKWMVNITNPLCLPRKLAAVGCVSGNSEEKKTLSHREVEVRFFDNIICSLVSKLAAMFS